MDRRDRAKLADVLELQGARVRKTKSGFLALNPATQKTVSWHASPTSDGPRGSKNLITDIRAAGFDFPQPHNTRKKVAA